jgi:hypothetical protein
MAGRRGTSGGSNQKQAGSNLINAEFHNGRCQTFCEQCFVNFGDRGNCKVRGFMADTPQNEQMFRDIEKAQTDERAEARQVGGIPSVIYTPPPRTPSGTPKPSDPNLELLARTITKTGKGLLNIPMKKAWEPLYVTARGAEKKRQMTIEGFGEVPTILRVSSMSDSSWASSMWIDAIRDTWGDQCFFNSCIKAIKDRPKMLDHFHKLVVTLNPGKQTMPPIEPCHVRPAWDSPQRLSQRIVRCMGRAGRVGSATARRKQCAAEVLAAFAKEQQKRTAGFTTLQANPKVDHFPLGSMGPVRDKSADFLHPLTLSQVTGNAGDERLIKFYRVRALATVHPYINDIQDQTGNPLVVTQMRFVNVGHLLEFARRYQLTVHIDVKPGAKGEKALLPYIAPFQQLKGTLFTLNNKAKENKAYVRSAEDDYRNGSPYRGQDSVFTFRSNYLRNSVKLGFDHCDYVCDRAWGSCKHCGLCASLDGQGTTVRGQRWTNPINVMPDGQPWPARAKSGGYIQTRLEAQGRSVPEDDYFRAIMADISGKHTSADDDFVENPGGYEPAHIDDAKAALWQAWAYSFDGVAVDAGFCESWDTHEDEATVIAFAFWSLLCQFVRQGDSGDVAMIKTLDAVMEATGGLEILDGVEDVFGMIDDTSPWVWQFGPVH